MQVVLIVVVESKKPFESHYVMITRPCRSTSNLNVRVKHRHCLTTTTMGKLNIAHHKSYHPYRRDNIEKVRKDEEEAKLKEEKEEGRMMLAVSSGRCT